MEVKLPPGRLPRPRRAAEDGPPVVRSPRPAGGSVAGRVSPDVPVRMRAVAARPRRSEPGVLVARVVQDQVEDDPDAAAVRLPDEVVEIGLGAKGGVDPCVVSHVVAAVEVGRRVDRGQPDGVDSQAVRSRPEVVEMLDDAGQVADAVAVAVREAPGIDLSEDPFAPPIVARESRRRTGGRGRCRAPGILDHDDIPSSRAHCARARHDSLRRYDSARSARLHENRRREY